MWSDNVVPGTNDDVMLNYDIIIDVDAYCRSLNVNVHNVTINTGMHLYITGNNDNADTLLSRYVIVDTTVSPPDTFKTIDFYYDSLKRNISYISLQYSSNGIVNYKNVDSFFYNGGSSLPFKASNYFVSYYNGDSSHNTNTRFFNYQNEKLVYDSSVNYTIHYTYFPNIIVCQKVNNSTASTVTDTAYVEYDGNGNIVHQADTTQSNGEQNFYYVFDNHPNPFNSTQLNRWRVLNSIETSIEQSFAKNNMLQVNQYYNDGITHHYQSLYGYGYKANGYAKEIWGYDAVNPSVVQRGKALFIYTR